MHMHEHLIITFIVGGISLWLLDALTWSAMGIMLVTTLVIDLDHVINYIGAGNRIRFKEAYDHHLYHFKHKKERFLIFHTLEFHLVLFYLSTQSWTWFLIFFSAVLHLLTDQVGYYLHHKSLKSMKPWMSWWFLRERIRQRVKDKVAKYEDLRRKGRQNIGKKLHWQGNRPAKAARNKS